MLKLLSKRWMQVFLLLVLLAGIVMIRLQDPPMVQRWRQITFDTYNRLMPRPAGEGVVIIDIDEDSLRRYGQWPWPRSLVADIPVVLKEMGAKATVFDIVFSERDRTSPHLMAETLPKTEEMISVRETLKNLPDNDEVFGRKISDLGNVVTGFVGANQITKTEPLLKSKIFNEGIHPDPYPFIMKLPYFTASIPVISKGSAGNGSFTMLPEQDGIVRKVPLLIGHRLKSGKVNIYPSLSLEALRVALGKSYYKVKSFGKPIPQGYGIQSVSVGKYKIPTDIAGNLQVYYTGHRQSLYIPAWKVLDKKDLKSLIKDKIVFVGASAIGLQDLRTSPLDASLPGVEVHAEIVEQILSGQFLRRPDFFNGAEIWVTIIVSLFFIFVAPFLATAILALFGALLIGGGGLGVLYAYQHFGYLLDPIYPTLSILIIFIVSSVLTNLRAELERRAVKTAFSHYVSPALMDELTKDPSKLKLGGEVRDLSVMFTDIRNFTSISESMDPGELIKMMNDFLTPMTSCVLENRGTVDKYMGDAMMAFWNAPLDDPDHATHACTTALQMLKALEDVNKKLHEKAEGKEHVFHELKAGIGLNTGHCSVGNMGSKQRFAYSALGDTVNLASRLEGQTKQYGVSILVTKETKEKAPAFAMIEVDLLAVKGRKEPEHVYALLGDHEMAEQSDFKEFSDKHAKMLSAYRAQDWDTAEEIAKACRLLRPDLSGLYSLYLERIAAFKETHPANDWQGVWIATEK